jgi:hypothetical protein
MSMLVLALRHQLLQGGFVMSLLTYDYASAVQMHSSVASKDLWYVLARVVHVPNGTEYVFKFGQVPSGNRVRGDRDLVQLKLPSGNELDGAAALELFGHIMRTVSKHAPMASDALVYAQHLAVAWHAGLGDYGSFIAALPERLQLANAGTGAHVDMLRFIELCAKEAA